MSKTIKMIVYLPILITNITVIQTIMCEERKCLNLLIIIILERDKDKRKLSYLEQHTDVIL